MGKRDFRVDNPKSLQQAVFYFISKRFCNRGGEEQRQFGPKRTTPQTSNAPWYDNVPVGKNTLQSMVKDMCVEAGIWENLS